MFQFRELSKNAQFIAAEEFMKRSKVFIGDFPIKRSIVNKFLSQSNVHRFDQKGSLLGKVVKKDGQEMFVPGDIY